MDEIRNDRKNPAGTWMLVIAALLILFGVVGAFNGGTPFTAPFIVGGIVLFVAGYFFYTRKVT
jgi:hypothetical protein